MLYIYSKNGNKCLSVEFDKFRLYNIFRKISTNSTKGVDSYYESSVWVLGFKFTYTNVNYDDIVFIELKADSNYTSSDNAKNVEILKETLKTWIDTNTYHKQYPPFNWNYSIDEDGKYVYYITGIKKYFKDNGLECLVNPLREITFDKNKNDCFTKYRPYKTNKVLKIEKSLN